MNTVWKIWFHPKDRHSHCGYGRCMEGSRSEVEGEAKKIAGNTYTFTIKQGKNRKPRTPYKKK